ncbi:DUF1648 domain-containing protein [Ktedonosporobacter rubrisoli]|uniref:DUF1648 domain-containing protein n=1 Tax=Ktedonosporobacter rubrisoli TaxID=2509675 RepID=A0A4V0Z087_KTERU|nr:SdpI family protein [Ktedonosporobacter rubrisoli]QBD82361.1 DUF1648 domain-containing protein [Ktedonosporobacter rubrisoli]
MQPLLGNNGRGRRNSLFTRQLGRFILVVIALQVFAALATYPFLPAQIPSHWNIVGQIDGYMPKATSAIFFPSLSIGLCILALLSQIAITRYSADTPNLIRRVPGPLLAGLILFLFVLQLTTLAIALGIPLDMSFVICLTLSLFYIVLGNYMGKLRRNAWIGIRTPWTLASETVWERTHRLGGWAFVAVGLLGLIVSFVPVLRLWAMIGPLLLLGIGLYAYSYIVYRRVGMPV